MEINHQHTQRTPRPAQNEGAAQRHQERQHIPFQRLPSQNRRLERVQVAETGPGADPDWHAVLLPARNLGRQTIRLQVRHLVVGHRALGDVRIEAALRRQGHEDALRPHQNGKVESH